MVNLKPQEVEMRYELGIAASIMATLYCFRVVGAGNRKVIFWEFFIYLVLSTILFMGVRYVAGFSGKKFFSAENLWVSFCFGFLAVPTAVLIGFLLLNLLLI